MPDLIHVVGTVPQPAFTADDASFSIRYRRGPAFPGEHELVWSIAGETGEIRVRSMAAHLQVAGKPDPVEIEIHDFATGQVEVVTAGYEDEWLTELPPPARNVAGLYERFAAGPREGRVPTFQDAVQRHEQLEALLREAGW